MIQQAISEEVRAENVYNAFWRNLVENEDGTINMLKLRKQLFDYFTAIENVSQVYNTITNGKVTRLLTDPEVVLNVIKETYDVKEQELSFKEGDRIIYDWNGQEHKATVQSVDPDGFNYVFDEPVNLGTRLGSMTGGKAYLDSYKYFKKLN